jgi:16S rRNA (guanine527-N7)-methyltransferase
LEDATVGLRFLADEAAALGTPLDSAMLAAFGRYRDLLLEWNARINLTAITDPRDVEVRHFLDSLSCVLPVPVEQRRETRTLIDIGSGAGFPGLVLALAFPAWRVTLLEATGKKVRFLETVIEELGLGNVSAVTGRAEELAHLTQYRGAFDIATARAVASLPTLLEYCAPFVRPGGMVLLPKKGDMTEELEAGRRAAAELDLAPPGSVAIPPLAGLDDNRCIVVAKQLHRAPLRYPRPAPAPRKHPLG